MVKTLHLWSRYIEEKQIDSYTVAISDIHAILVIIYTTRRIRGTTSLHSQKVTHKRHEADSHSANIIILELAHAYIAFTKINVFGDAYTLCTVYGRRVRFRASFVSISHGIPPQKDLHTKVDAIKYNSQAMQEHSR